MQYSAQLKCRAFDMHLNLGTIIYLSQCLLLIHVIDLQALDVDTYVMYINQKNYTLLYIAKLINYNKKIVNALFILVNI